MNGHASRKESFGPSRPRGATTLCEKGKGRSVHGYARIECRRGGTGGVHPGLARQRPGSEGVPECVPPPIAVSAQRRAKIFHQWPSVRGTHSCEPRGSLSAGGAAIRALDDYGVSHKGGLLNTQITAIFICLLLPLLANAADVSVQIECESRGTTVTGDKSLKTFKERFVFEEKVVNKDDPKGPWKIIKTEFFLNGIEHKGVHAKHTGDYLLFQASSETGSGFNKRLNVFAFYIDLKTVELERVATFFPRAEEERTRSACKKVTK